MHHAYVTLNLCACCFFFLETPLPPACLTWITRPYPSGLTLDITAIQKTLLSHRPVFDLLLGLMALQLSSSHLGPLCVVTFGHMTAAPPGHKKMSVESKSASDPVVSDSVTPQTVALQAPLSMGFPRREYWHGLHFLLHIGIFPIQRSNPGLLHCRWILYHLSHQVNSVLGYCWRLVPKMFPH